MVSAESRLPWPPDGTVVSGRSGRPSRRDGRDSAPAMGSSSPPPSCWFRFLATDSRMEKRMRTAKKISSPIQDQSLESERDSSGPAMDRRMSVSASTFL